MSTENISIADLPITDDLNIPVDPEQYQDQVNPAPCAPGNYRMVVTKHSVRKNQDGSLNLQDGKYPTVVIEQIKIVEPSESERLVGVYTDVRFKPFERKGATGAATPASDLWDLLRAFDETTRIEDANHAKQLLMQFFQTGASFLGQLAWHAYDKAYADAAFAALGVPRASVSKDVAKGIYNTAKKSGKDFVVGGVRQQAIVGPSGEQLEARVKIGRYFPSLTEVGTGKDERNRSRIALGAFAK